MLERVRQAANQCQPVLSGPEDSVVPCAVDVSVDVDCVVVIHAPKLAYIVCETSGSWGMDFLRAVVEGFLGHPLTEEFFEKLSYR